MEKAEIYKQIVEHETKIRELRSQMMNKVKFRHLCPYCHAEWDGYKENIQECTFCKRRLSQKDMISITCEKACAKFDELIKVRGEISKTFGNKVWTFKAIGDEIGYLKVVDGSEIEKEVVARSYEVLKDWNWMSFLKEFVL